MPWEVLLKDLEEGNKRKRWIDRAPYAYWKGNPSVAATRQDLLKCNVSDQQDWNARVYAQVLYHYPLCIPIASPMYVVKMQNLRMSLKTTCRIGYENQAKGTSNRIWQANALIGRNISHYPQCSWFNHF